MSDFDPYLKWLGIRATQRPVNHYRLLGLELFESDADVISSAADRQMAHVRTYQNGARAELSQQILNELAVARRCLLVAEQKDAYDKALRQSLAPKAKPAQPPAVPIVTTATPAAKPAANSPRSASPAPPVAVRADGNLRKKRQKRENSQMLMSVAGWVGGGLAAVAVSAYLINSGMLPGFGKKDPPLEDRDSQLVQNDNDKQEEPVATKKQPDKTKPPRKQTPSQVNRDKSPADKPSQKKDPKVVRNTPPAKVDPSAVDNPSHPNFVWNRSNLQRYPALNVETKNLLSEFKNSTPNQLHKFTASSTKGGDAAYSLVNQKLLVGLVISSFQDGTIRTIAPLKLGDDGIGMGPQIGRKYNAEKVLLAKPGYAVGAIEVSKDHPMKCIRLIYMKIQSDRLNPQEQYPSEWYPKKTRPFTRIPNPSGVPIVGVHGRQMTRTNVATLGLVGALITQEHQSLAATTPNANPPKTTGGNPLLPDNATDPKTNGTAKLLAAPSKAEIATAREELLQLYAAQIQAAKPNQQRLNSNNETRRNAEIGLARNRHRDLARLLSQDAMSESTRPTIQYALFQEAAAIGTQIGDLEVVLDAMREIESRFEFDYWTPMKKVVPATAANSVATEAFTFRQILDELIDEAVGYGELKTAGWLANWALDQVRKTDREQADKYKSLDRKISGLVKIQAANEKALQTLQTEPDDPSANESAGQYEFFIKQDVESALRYWAKSKDQRLLKLVELTKTKNSEDAKSLQGLAEAWRECGQANRTFKDKGFLEQSHQLLLQAASLLEGIEKRRLERMANELRAEIDGE